ncbi:MAG TPA: HD domain-containing phosphohydrolase, partial [Dehalococcoidia bacterium]|nr:HD domain-containing phosphohydrolase [Dehalococcoidia bacterium]
RTGASEIVIDDPRVEDVLVGTMFPAHLEAKAVQALHVLAAGAGYGAGYRPDHLVGVRAAVNALVRCLFPEPVGDPDLSGSVALEGYDYVHPVKVTTLSLLVGRLLGLSEADLVRLGLVAMLQNVGYLQLPPGLLETPGPLNEEQRVYLEGHPMASVDLLKDAGLDDAVLAGIAQHHERWNGSGYPTRLKGNAISIFARITAIADAFHALVSKRPHRPPMKRHEAIEFISAFSGELFDPELASLFTRRIPVYPAGIGVKLNTGEVGIVSNPNIGHIARPVVRVCVANGRPVQEPYDLDLSQVENMNKLIAEVIL